MSLKQLPSTRTLSALVSKPPQSVRPLSARCYHAVTSRARPISYNTYRSSTFSQSTPKGWMKSHAPVTPAYTNRCVEAKRWLSSSGSLGREAGKDAQKEIKSVQFEDVNASITSPTLKPTILIDVREPPELLSTGIIPTALSLPISQAEALFLPPAEFLTHFGYPKPGVAAAEPGSSAAKTDGGKGKEEDADLVFYCKAGVRARAVADLAVQAGYDPERIRVYDGSWLDWSKKGGRVEKWEGNED